MVEHGGEVRVRRRREIAVVEEGLAREVVPGQTCECNGNSSTGKRWSASSPASLTSVLPEHTQTLYVRLGYHTKAQTLPVLRLLLVFGLTRLRTKTCLMKIRRLLMSERMEER